MTLEETSQDLEGNVKIWSFLNQLSEELGFKYVYPTIW